MEYVISQQVCHKLRFVYNSWQVGISLLWRAMQVQRLHDSITRRLSCGSIEMSSLFDQCANFIDPNWFRDLCDAAADIWPIDWRWCQLVYIIDCSLNRVVHLAPFGTLHGFQREFCNVFLGHVVRVLFSPMYSVDLLVIHLGLRNWRRMMSSRIRLIAIFIFIGFSTTILQRVKLLDCNEKTLVELLAY